MSKECPIGLSFDALECSSIWIKYLNVCTLIHTINIILLELPVVEYIQTFFSSSSYKFQFCFNLFIYLFTFLLSWIQLLYCRLTYPQAIKQVVCNAKKMLDFRLKVWISSINCSFYSENSYICYTSRHDIVQLVLHKSTLYYLCIIQNHFFSDH